MEIRKLSILLIEDDEEDYFITKSHLSEVKDLQYEITWVNTCPDGKKQLEQNTFDVCLVDYRLGDWTGIEFLKTVNAFNQKTPFIFLTGQGDREIDVQAMEAGASDYLVKGNIDAYILERTIRHAIERKKYESQLLDITEELSSALKEIQDNQQKLIDMENLKSVRELAGAVAHEFAQPLQALSNYLELMKIGGKTDKYLSKSEQMVSRIAELTQNLRNITSLSKKDYVDTQILDLKKASVDNGNNNAYKVLVVDDEDLILETILEMLQIRGIECDGTTNGHEALDFIKKNNYKLIISDVSMPKMSGPEFFRRVKEMGNKSIFIFLTGYEITDDVKDVIALADGLINKPVSFDDFFKTLDQLNIVANKVH
jgi:CheY-like chemotaxis protein